MKLAYWMYAGPAHIGVLRVSSSFKNVHAIMHAPLGDDYFNVMRSMLERERDFTPVTASIVDRHVLARGSQEKVVENITRKNKEETPDLILLTPTCTSSILQEDLQNFVEGVTRNAGVTTNAVQRDITTSYSTPLLIEKENLLNTTSKVINSVQKKNKSEAYQVEASQELYSQNALVTPQTNVFFDTNDLNDSKEVSNKLNKNSDICKTSAELNKSLAHKETPLFVITSGEREKNILKKPLEKNSKIPSDINEDQPDVILADVNHYRVNELQAADRSLEQIVRFYIEKAKKQNNLNIMKTEKPSVNIIGIFTLGFHNQHDCRELKRLFNDLGIKINEIIPEGGNVNNLKNLPQAWFNFVPYREVGLMTAVYLKSEFNMPYVSITPMGLIDTALCIRSICKIITNQDNILNFQKHKQQVLKENLLNVEFLFNKYIDQQTRFVSQAAWFSRSIDCQNLTGKKAVVFGDATHSAAMTKILAREMGIRVSCAGTYCKHDADWFREQVNGFCDQILITDDHTQVGDTIAKLEPAAIFGTQMERHVGKRLDIPCGVISAPVHIQNFPLGYRPFLGYEGTNQIADLIYNSFNLGMEDHLLQIFGGHDSVVNPMDNIKTSSKTNMSTQVELKLWSPEGLAELNKVPGFVRGKVKRNTEKYALQNNIAVITVEVMYAAKEALSN
uniref:Light-independent protochlorophyllide reductase subunit B n=1 Tax=Pleodorina starrii TaxID=330485 RepID=M9P841_9CHLO|nr:ChlB subunit of protochlorophyllide reductase [Pleodorina starrii]AFY64400.1 ChlB subunit of protochlorophyllide reductase [Pleodorina starrii]